MSLIPTIIASVLCLGSFFVGCSSGGSTSTDLFPENYSTLFQEVRDCRRSADHDLNYVRVLADEAAYDPYVSRAAPFPEGAIILKEEYANADCTSLTGYTVMRKEAEGYNPEGGNFRWQRVDEERHVVEDGAVVRCMNCHALCGVAPDGYERTCAVP